ncbi:MAG: hypothetical protein HQL75_09715 [Magnetococcales bacterium]|nr:hypothetical protein [Magnetococcales bacterium]
MSRHKEPPPFLVSPKPDDPRERDDFVGLHSFQKMAKVLIKLSRQNSDSGPTIALPGGGFPDDPKQEKPAPARIEVKTALRPPVTQVPILSSTSSLPPKVDPPKGSQTFLGTLPPTLPSVEPAVPPPSLNALERGIVHHRRAGPLPKRIETVVVNQDPPATGGVVKTAVPLRSEPKKVGVVQKGNPTTVASSGHIPETDPRLPMVGLIPGATAGHHRVKLPDPAEGVASDRQVAFQSRTVKVAAVSSREVGAASGLGVPGGEGLMETIRKVVREEGQRLLDHHAGRLLQSLTQNLTQNLTQTVYSAIQPVDGGVRLTPEMIEAVVHALGTEGRVVLELEETPMTEPQSPLHRGGDAVLRGRVAERCGTSGGGRSPGGETGRGAGGT